MENEIQKAVCLFVKIKMPENQKQIYNLTPEEILEKFSSNYRGLSEEEAKKRLKEHGLNRIKKRQNWKWLKLLFNQFNDALVWILLMAAGLAFAFSEFRDVVVILIIVGINATIGFFQEWKAERILDSMKKLTSDKALVVRGGEKKEIDSKFIVPGDIIFISSGDNVPADGYLLEAYDLKINTFVFTGESSPQHKRSHVLSEREIALADIDNMVFMGETVARGEAKFIVVATGMKTELGRIAHLTQALKNELTPMQKQMRRLGKDVALISVFIGVIVIIAGQYFRMSLYQNFLFALALSVSVVPEGLPAAISVALSFGMKRLFKDNILAKKLNAVETLGSVDIICTDKTGTITKNELTVTQIVVNGETIQLTGSGYEPKGEFIKNDGKIDPGMIPNLSLFFKIGALCNDAVLEKEDEKYKIIGDPTEGAIIVASKKYLFAAAAIEEEKNESEPGFFERGENKVDENPFSSDRMRMSVIYRSKNKTISYVKGSPDVIIDLCKFQKIGDKILEFTEEEKNKARAVYNEMSGQALRVLAFGYRELESGFSHFDAETDLVWVGMMAMIDPPRPEVAKAIHECREAGIKAIMITGDYEITARAIARQTGLINLENSQGKSEELVINGKSLDALSDNELYKKIKEGTCIFARIAPEQKLRIATVLKSNGQIIAMTGDGVNDAPALKYADIGVAMGIMGTDVSKEAADMILLDDNFASIVKGVREGRTIFSNLKKFVHYVFTSNASELLTVIFGVVLQIPSPITAIQILAVDLGTDVFPSFALGLEPPEAQSDKKKIACIKEGIITFKGFRRILYLGVIMATGAIVAFIWSMMRGGWNFEGGLDTQSWLYIKSTSAAYAVLSMTQMANLLQSRSERLSPFQLGFFKNRYAIGSIIISVAILLSFMYVPVLQYYTGMLPIDRKDWAVVGLFTLVVFLWEEARKERER